MRTGLDRCQESISWISARSESTARFYRNRYDKTKPGAISTGSPIPSAHGRYSSRFCICLALIVFRSSLPVAAIAPVIPIHSSITNYEPIIVDIPMTTSANAAAQEDIPYTSSARSTSVPTSISGVVAVYKLTALIVSVAENSTATMTPSLAQSCCRQNYRQQYSQNDH